MKITSIKSIGRNPVYDISVTYKNFVLSNGIITHNTGSVYSANTVWIISRRIEKEGTDLVGYSFTITVDKSRFVREKSKVPLTVSFEDGIEPWSGLFELATDLGYIEKPKMGWYNLKDSPNKMFRQKETDSMEFWAQLLDNEEFKKAVSDKYILIRES